MESIAWHKTSNGAHFIRNIQSASRCIDARTGSAKQGGSAVFVLNLALTLKRVQIYGVCVAVALITPPSLCVCNRL